MGHTDPRLARDAVKEEGGYTMMLSWKVVCLWGGDSTELHPSWRRSGFNVIGY